MLRGSKPGEHRGGRKRNTPNKRTVLTDRILSIGLEYPSLSPHGFLLKVVKDPKLPADTRMAVAPQSLPLKRTLEALTGRPGARRGATAPAPVSVPREWTPLTLDALFGVVQDAAADAEARRKAALKIAEYLLPKVAKKAKALPDEYEFRVSPDLASAYRDIQLELRALMNGPNRKIPAIAEMIRTLQARSDAIRRRLQVPCPTKYGVKDMADDSDKLAEIIRLRDNGTALTETQKAEEAHRRVRFDVFVTSPDWVLRRRLKALEEAELLQHKNRFFGFPAAPFSHKERDDLEFLRPLYSRPKPGRDKADYEAFVEMFDYHPFRDELPSSDGNFYPPVSNVRRVGVGTITWSGMNPPPVSSLTSFYNAPPSDPIQSAEAEKPQ